MTTHPLPWRITPPLDTDGKWYQVKDANDQEVLEECVSLKQAEKIVKKANNDDHLA